MGNHRRGSEGRIADRNRRTQTGFGRLLAMWKNGAQNS